MGPVFVAYDLFFSCVAFHPHPHLLLFRQDLSLIVENLTHICQMYFPILYNWTSPFPILGLLGDILHLYSNFRRHFCQQTVENLIRCRILRCLIWFCTDCRCPTETMLGLYGLGQILELRCSNKFRITFNSLHAG